MRIVRQPIRILAIAAGALLATRCGYVSSGNWIDDPGNWERAFRSSPPKEYSILNSVYWRNPHFTYEGGYYFRLRLPQQQRDKLTSQPGLITIAAAAAFVDGPCLERPAWFAPKGPKAYRVFTLDNDTTNQRILIDSSGDEVFLSGCQW